MSLPDFSSNNAFATARLDRPDRALRKIAIKQMMGQQLNANELDRLARRQGVEARYEQFGNPNFSGGGGGVGMDSAYARAGAPVLMRSRLSSEGSALGRLAADFGGDNIGGVQQLNRERLLRERELGNLRLDAARFANGHMQEDYDWERAVRERNAAMSDLKLNAARFANDHMQEDYDLRARIANANLKAAETRNSELARKISEAESGRNALMNLEREQRQMNAVPLSLLDRRYFSPYAAVDKGISDALKNNNFGAYTALSEQRNAMLRADEKARAEAVKMQNGRKIPTYEQVSEAYNYYTRKTEDALANGRQDEAEFYVRAREALLPQRGNVGAPKSGTPTADEMKNQLGGNNPKSRTAAPLSTAAGGKKAAAAQQKAYGEVKEVF